MGASAAFLAEYCVVGTLLWHADLLGETLTVLHPGDFSQQGLRGVYQAMGTLFFAGDPVDAITVLDKAGEAYRPALEEAMKSDSPEMLETYRDIIVRETRLNRIHQLAERLVSAENLEMVDGTLDKLNALMVSRRELDIVTAQQGALDFLERMESKERPEYLTWGMAELDKTLLVEFGDFVAIGGYPSAGKTLLSIQFATHLAAKYRVGYYSLETKTKKLVDRLISYKSGVPLGSIKRRIFSDEDWDAMAKAAAEFGKLSMDSVNASGMTVRDIQSIVLSRRHQVVFIDYLQKVHTGSGTRFDQVTNISLDLSDMAQTHNIAVVALAQLQRPERADPKTGKLPTPTMSSFRESGQIEQDIDVGMLLWPEDLLDNHSNRILKVAKNKEGPRTALTMHFDGARQIMTPLPKTTEVAAQYAAAGRAAKAENRRNAIEDQQTQVTLTELYDESVPF